MPIEVGKKALEATQALVSNVKETESGKAAHEELGKTALTLSKAINNVLIPIAAVNFGFEKARKYFEEKFESDLVEVTSDIPLESIREPKASVAAPVLQGLGFSHEEPPLKQMYLNLLRSAMDSRAIGADHPSFSEVVRQLSAEEAPLLSLVMASPTMLPVVEVRLKAPSGGFLTIERNILNFHDMTTGNPNVYQGLSAMVDNWSRLGLVSVAFDRNITDTKQYDWAPSRPEYKKHLQSIPKNCTIELQRGILEISDFGRTFYKAVS